MKRGKMVALACAGVVVSALALAWWGLGEAHYGRMLVESPEAGRCERKLRRAELTESVRLARDFLLAHQKPAGNFDYEYDFEQQTLSSDDNEVRQAGALWGLTSIYAHDPNERVAAAVERGLAFFHEHSRRKRGARCIVYPGSSTGGTGTVALVALAHIDYLRALPTDEANAPKHAEYRARLAQYLRFLQNTVRPDGLWPSRYNRRNCAPEGEPSPYSDGEALLALVKAAKYLGFTELVPTITASAAAGRRFNIDAALAEHPDSDVTKGYYQWSSMAFYELATSDIPGTASYADTVLRLADWMIDEHDVLWRLKNTGYAFEGIVHAYLLAKQRNDSARAQKYGCVIDVGLSRLLAWQVGGPLAARLARSAAGDARARGGVQNGVRDTVLRIDVTQHQAFATVLALRHVYTAD